MTVIRIDEKKKENSFEKSLNGFRCFSLPGTIDQFTWWPMTRSLIILFLIPMFIWIFLPVSESTSDVVPPPSTVGSSLTIKPKPNITILMMFPDIDQFIPNLNSLIIVYEYIVHRYQISNWLNVNLQVKDSNCSISQAPHVLVTTMLTAMPDVVFGPFCGIDLF